jgi:hypothetical protein
MGGFTDEAAAFKALIADGIISNKTLNELRDFSTIQDAVGDHYDVSEIRGGKAALKARPSHGGSNSRDNLNALLMAIDAEKNGPIVVQRPGMGHRSGLKALQGPTQETFADRRVRKAAERILSPGAITTLASPGLREGAVKYIDSGDRLTRAINYAIKLNNGYDHITGSRLTMGLDGGHILPHNKYPELSTASFNMAPENKYVNRAKGNREGADLINSLTNSLMKKFGAASKQGAVSYSQMPSLWNIGRGFN